MKDFDQQAMAVLMGIVKAGRKAKNATRTSLKGVDYVLRIKIPAKAFSLKFSMERGGCEEIIRYLLRIPALYLEEENFDMPFLVSDQPENYPWYAGEAEDTDSGILAQLWTRELLWAA